MYILHSIPSFGLKSGGTSTCTYDLLSALNHQSCPADVLTLNLQNTLDKIIGEGEAWIKALPFDARTPFQFSHNLKQFLLEERIYDLYHTNGLWLYCNHITASIARKKDKPYLISPHGMLYPQALSRSSWKKVLMRKFCFDDDLARAACIHVTCVEEMDYYRRLGFENPVAVIPNLVSFSGIDKIMRRNGVFRIGFLGRIHPIKNIDVLIKAWSKVNTSGCELVLVGDGEKSYVDRLKGLVLDLNLSNVLFTGFLQGKEKQQMIASFDYQVLPSQSENFGMVVPEALIQGVPVIASKGTPWEELNTHRCGWWVDNDVDTLAATICKALNTSEEERLVMGERGKQLIKDNYSVEMVAGKMKRLYEWILYGGEKPEFVYLK